MLTLLEEVEQLLDVVHEHLYPCW